MDEKEINEAQSEPSAEVKETKKTKKKSELDALREEVEKKDAELTEQKDKYLRLAAEYDNFRKRSAKERDGIYTDAVADTVNEILPVLDNLERAALYKDALGMILDLAVELPVYQRYVLYAYNSKVVDSSTISSVIF